MPRGWGNFCKAFLFYGVALGLAWWLWRSLDAGMLRGYFWIENIWLASWAVLQLLVGRLWLIQRGRMSFVRRSGGVALPWSVALRVGYWSWFWNHWLPGVVTTDAYRSYAMHRRGLSVVSAIQWNLVERGGGLLAILWLVALLLLCLPWPWVGTSSWLLVGLAVVAAVVYLVIAHYLLHEPWRFAGELWLRYSVIFQLNMTLHFGLLAMSLGWRGAENAKIAMVAGHLGSLASMVPLTIGGLGVREWWLSVATPLWGWVPEQAVVFGLVLFLASALASGLGSVVVWLWFWAFPDKP